MNESTTNNLESNPETDAGPFVPLSPRVRTAPTLPPTTKPASNSLDGIQKALEQIVQSDDDENKVIGQFAELACSLTNAIWCGQFKQHDHQMLECVSEHYGAQPHRLNFGKSSVLPVAASAVMSAKSCVANQGVLTVIATPILDGSSGTDQCLCLALRLKDTTVEPFLLVLQLVATEITRWYEQDAARRLDWEADATSAIAELMGEIAGCDEPRQAVVLAANRLGRFLGASSVAIGLCRHQGSKRTRIVAISGATEVDKTSDFARQLESTLNETLVRNSVTVLPGAKDNLRHMKLAHRKLVESQQNSNLVSAPLTTSNGDTLGAWLCLLPNNDRQPRAIQFAKTASRFLADALDASSRAAAGPFARLKQRSAIWARGKSAKLSGLVIFIVAVILAIPIPHQIDCSCTVKPMIRRFAVAPHDGILLMSYVKPGDTVSAGQVVARMDDRELNLQHAELYAQRKSAVKKRDVNHSARDAAATKISEFEIEQLDAKIRLVEFKIENLEIRSEVDGVVLRGDLENALGAPIRRGDVLAEISSLDRLRLELDIPEADLAYIKVGQSISVNLEGNPRGLALQQIESVHPISEIRNQENVFVAKASLANADQALRPGMQGRAKVLEGKRSIGWILFHRPFHKLRMYFSVLSP